jgi:acyl-CoA hydrolase
MGDRDLAPKTVAASTVRLIQLMSISDANIAGFVHGGSIMKLADTAAGLAAIRHSGGIALTAAMDSMSFLAPVKLDDIVTVVASVNDVGTTSMEVGVRVEAENYLTGGKVHTSSAYFVFVALDEEGRPRAVPALVAETGDEKRRQMEAKLRREARLARKAAIDASREGGS